MAHHSAANAIVASEARRTPIYELLTNVPELGGAIMPFERNAEIFGEGEPSEYVYKVVSGAVRTYRVLSDGRRQVGAFYLPGDVFGLEMGGEHAGSAEAVVNSKILFVRRNALMQASERDGAVAGQLLAITARELRRAQNHTLLLIKSAQERVAAFLLEMGQRLSGALAFDLPMSRRDIADYLGLTIETVSRTLTQFEESATIKLVATRRVVVQNPSALSALNS
jgi:CRP/FNR family transcriptional regulator, nitrogen fixation regulation protein